MESLHHIVGFALVYGKLRVNKTSQPPETNLPHHHPSAETPYWL